MHESLISSIPHEYARYANGGGKEPGVERGCEGRAGAGSPRMGDPMGAELKEPMGLSSSH